MWQPCTHRRDPCKMLRVLNIRRRLRQDILHENVRPGISAMPAAQAGSAQIRQI